ncbi:hypothetical protein P9112_006369 [Eukaryota sp. TZLM1-RC]
MADKAPTLTHCLISHKKSCTGIVHIGDNSHIISSSEDGTLVLWHLSGSQGVPLFVLPFPCAIASIFYASKLNAIAAGLENGHVAIIKVCERSLEPVAHVKVHSKKVSGVAFDPAHDRFITVGHDKKLSLFDCPELPSSDATFDVRSFTIASAWPGCLTVTPSGDRVYIGTYGRDVIAADIIDGQVEVVGALHGHRGSVRSCVFDPVTSFLMTGSFDKLVFAWETNVRVVSSIRPIAKLSAHFKKVKAMAIEPTDRVLVSACDGGMIACYELRSGKRVRFFKGSGNKVLSLCIIGNRLVSGDSKGVLRVWDLGDDGVAEVEVGHDVVEEKQESGEEVSEEEVDDVVVAE